jgi:hypothetical protein
MPEKRMLHFNLNRHVRVQLQGPGVVWVQRNRQYWKVETNAQGLFVTAQAWEVFAAMAEVGDLQQDVARYFYVAVDLVIDSADFPELSLART